MVVKIEKKNTLPAFMKVGAEAKKAYADVEAKMAANAALYDENSLWRFWLPVPKPGMDNSKCQAEITFLDGELDEEGVLIQPTYYEHRIQHNGKWTEFTCVEEFDVCPLCKSGNKPGIVSLFTIINHTPYTSQTTGKVFNDRRMLFVATKRIMSTLNVVAEAYGGLRGIRCHVTRTGDKEPRVGNNFIPKGQEALEDWALKEGDDFIKPANYGKEVQFRSRDELIALGIGGGGNITNISDHI